MKKRKLFCEISPLCYKISHKKECLLHDVKDIMKNEKIATEKNTVPLPVILKSHSSKMLRNLCGVDMQLQEAVCRIF